MDARGRLAARSGVERPQAGTTVAINLDIPPMDGTHDAVRAPIAVSIDTRDGTPSGRDPFT